MNKAMKMKGAHGRPKAKKGTLKRVLRLLFTDYRPQMVVVAICIVLTSASSTVAGLFMNFFIGKIEIGLAEGLDAVIGDITVAVLILISIYLVGLLANFTYTRLMAIDHGWISTAQADGSSYYPSAAGSGADKK